MRNGRGTIARGSSATRKAREGRPGAEDRGELGQFHQVAIPDRGRLVAVQEKDRGRLVLARRLKPGMAEIEELSIDQVQPQQQIRLRRGWSLQLERGCRAAQSLDSFAEKSVPKAYSLRGPKRFFSAYRRQRRHTMRRLAITGIDR